MGESFDEQKSKRKRTAIIIVIIILLCLILLCLLAILGLTWVIFNNSTDDGKIGINVTTGRVKVDIVDAENNSLVGDVLQFVSSNKNGKIYFEPGIAYYTEGFSVMNTGSIPISFRVYVSEDEKLDIQEFEEAFDIWITTDIQSQDNAEGLKSFSGGLEVEQKSETYYLVIKMKETAGNEFQNKTYSGIGVTVYAVQGNVEIE